MRLNSQIMPAVLTFVIALILPGMACAFGSQPVQQPAGIDGGSPGDPDCVIRSPTFSVHMSVYQRLRQQSLETHCQDIPEAGPTHMVFDLHSADKRIRNVPLRVRVVEVRSNADASAVRADEGEKSERTILELPPETYKTGVIEVHAKLDRAGNYAVLLEKVGTKPEQGLRIPLQVAMVGTMGSVEWLLAAVLGLAISGLLGLRVYRGASAIPERATTQQPS